jgi:small-conductance mechanosensitive channel
MNSTNKYLSLQTLLKGILCISVFALFISTSVVAQIPSTPEHEIDATEPDVAAVNVDGKNLFFVRGISSYPAQKRAKVISDRIYKAASNYSISADSVLLVPNQDYIRIVAGTEFIMNVYEVDGKWEQIDNLILAKIFSERVKSTILEYREARSKPVLLKKSLYAFGALVILAVVLFVFFKLIRKVNILFENRIKTKLETLESKSFKLISSGQLWKSIHVLVKSLKIVVAILIVAVFLNYILSLFPWTNSIAAYILQIFTEPIVAFGQSIVNFLPSLAFLIIIFFVTRYVLKLTKLLFLGIGQGGIVIKEFDPEWAMPTFKIVRTFVLAFAIVIAYPYIPGSNTSAFKGVSVFLGVLLSLGSSSFIGNVIAGYSMTYRRAFRKGDRIKVDDLTGYVEEQKLLVTRLRSLKNEEIVIPNSVLLNSNIINYTTRAKELGLILHTAIGIGYETPWRLVHSMLLEAADRTDGLSKDPKPYVLQKALGDFAITYEINGYCKDVSKMFFLYTQLHQNILDVFNENNVQIMTPAYEGDPEIPKVVPVSEWGKPLNSSQSPENKSEN